MKLRVKLSHKFFKKTKYALENLKIESLVSKHLKQFFDKKYGPNWHCIVGCLNREKFSFLCKL